MTLHRFERSVAVANEGDTVQSAAAKLHAESVGCIVVTRGRKPVAILTDRDLALRVVAEGKNPCVTLVRDVSTYGPFTIDSKCEPNTAASLMQRHGVRRLPIVDGNGDLVGIVSADDLLILYSSGLFALGQGVAANSELGE